MISASLVKELRDLTGAGMMDCKKALVETNGNIEEAVTYLREHGIAKAAKKADRIAAEGKCDFAVAGNKAVVFEINSETDFVAKNENFQKLVEKVGRLIVNGNASNTEEALQVVDANGETIEKLLISATATIGEKISLRRVQVITKEDGQVFGAYSHMGGKIISLTKLDGADEETAKDVSMHVAAMNPKYVREEEVDQADLEKEKEILTQETINEGKPANIAEKIVAGRIQKYLKEICLVHQPFVKNPDQTVDQFVKSQKGNVVSFVRLEVGEGIEKKVEDFAAEVAAQLNQ